MCLLIPNTHSPSAESPAQTEQWCSEWRHDDRGIDEIVVIGAISAMQLDGHHQRENVCWELGITPELRIRGIAARTRMVSGG
jgi:hypothetical protein